MTPSQPSPHLTDAPDTSSKPQDRPYTGGTTDLMTRILSANELEQTGEQAEAIAKYKKVVEADPEGVYGAIAQKAPDP